MGKIPLFTKEQSIIFHQIGKEPTLSSRFYFTGGTALAAFYLKHRYSEDLDFFSASRFDPDDIESVVATWTGKYGFTFTSHRKEVVTIYILTFNGSRTLKLDFGYYPHKQVEKSTKVAGVTVDSLWDIAINKLFAINQRSQVRDFVDLYFLLKHFTIWDLIYGVEVKFRKIVEPWLLASDVSIVETFDSLPRMIAPLTLPQFKEFYRDFAKKLAKQAIE